MEFIFLEDALNLGISNAPCPLKTLPEVLIIRPKKRKITNSLRQHFFRFFFLSPPTAESGGGNYELLYQNSIRKYEDDLEH